MKKTKSMKTTKTTKSSTDMPESVHDRKVQGYCPMGCGKTLFLGSGGYVTCSLLGCPNPTALSDIIADREHQHIVELKADNFTVRHPLRERLNDELMECRLHAYIAGLDGPPRVPGRYRVYGDSVHGWTWHRVDEPSRAV